MPRRAAYMVVAYSPHANMVASRIILSSMAHDAILKYMRVPNVRHE